MRTAVIITAITTLALALAVLTGVAGMYHAQNTGVYVAGYGFELIGPDGPGFFVCPDLMCDGDI